MITTLHYTDQWNREATKLMWCDREIKGLNLRSEGGGRASITMNMGLTQNSIGGGATNCTQEEFDALNLVRDMIRKSIVTREQAQDLLPILEKAGWKVFPR